MASDSTTKASILIRSYQPADQLRCEEIFRAGMLENGSLPGYVDYALETDMKDIEKNYLQIPDGHWWVAVRVDDNRIVGQIAGQPLKYGDPSYYNELSVEECEYVYELRRMAVASEAQRLGVGSQLLSTLINFARDRGYREVHLTTGTNRKKACAFYEKNGFIRRRIEKYSINVNALKNLTDSCQFTTALSSLAVFEEGEPITDEDRRLMALPSTVSTFYYVRHYHFIL